jgi:uncharacterized protein
MKKKRWRLRFHIMFWVCIGLGILWILYAPTPHRPLPSIQVKVAPLAPPIQSTHPDNKMVQLQGVISTSKDENRMSDKPKIAIVIDDVGLDVKNSKRAIDLPAYLTLSFMPYAPQLREQTKEARDQGHELLLHMPMEPMGHDNPGPGALLVDLSPDEIKMRFETALASFVGFDGVNNHMGSKFTANSAGMEIVIDELQQRGLFFLDSRTTAQTVGESMARQHGLPTIARDVFLDDTISPVSIKSQLDQTERVARQKGYAVAIGHPHSITLDVLEKWMPEMEKRGIVFVKVSDLVHEH